jgi:hypothetical protein
MQMSRSLSRRQVLQNAIGLAAATSLDGWASVASAESHAWLSGAFTQSAGSSGQNPQLVPPGPMTQAALAVTTQTAGTIGPGFAGLSYEKMSLCWAFFLLSDQVGMTLFRGLGQSLLRIGGTSVDSFIWTPNGVGNTWLQVAPSDVAMFAAFVKAVGWQCLYGVNLAGAANGTTTPDMAADEVACAVEEFGSSLFGIEIGNEPDVYGIPGYYFAGNWSLPQYIALWREFRAAIVARCPGVSVTGPAASWNAATWTIPYGQAVVPPGEISCITQHYYRANGNAPTSTAANMITPDARLATYLATLQAGSKKLGVPYRMAECNSYDSGGASGISNSYASSLWVIDFLFNCAQAGAAGVNLHGGGNSNGYQPIADLNGHVTAARPEYYGIMMFTMAGQGTLCSTQLSVGTLNVTAYAVQAANGNTNLMIVNKDLVQNLQLAIQLPGSAASATLVEMTQLSAGAATPQLTATDGVMIQGTSVTLGSTFVPGTPYTLTANGTQLSCYVPALSAVLITIVPTPAGPNLVSVQLTVKGNASTVVVGGTLQMIATGSYSDGSTAVLPDSLGNRVTGWNTSNHAVAKVSTAGHVTAVGLGPVTITAQIGNLTAFPCAITVVAASQ